MKVFEVFSPQNFKEEIDFDLQDDLIYFMNADPDFYRYQYFPLQTKFHQYCNAGKGVSPKAFKAVITKAYESYKKQFQLPTLEDTLNEDTLDEICEKLHNQELKHFQEQKQKKTEGKK